MNIVFLDFVTLKSDQSLNNVLDKRVDDVLANDTIEEDLKQLTEYGEFTCYENTEQELVFERVKDADIVITNKVKLDRTMLTKLSKLKCIVVAASGMDNIDLECANELGIKVKNSPGYANYSVAYHTLALYFQLNQSLEVEKKFVKNYQWQEYSSFSCYDQFYDLSNQIWGVIGLGQIGLKVAQIVQSFGARVIYYSSQNQIRSNQYEKCSLDELLSRSHVVSIHSALTAKTKYLIGKNELNAMKNCHTLINVARGAIFNELDLLEFLDHTDIKIGLDVLENEPLVKNCAMAALLERNRAKTIITPHMAWASVQSRKALTESLLKNVQDFLLFSA